VERAEGAEAGGPLHTVYSLATSWAMSWLRLATRRARGAGTPTVLDGAY